MRNTLGVAFTGLLISFSVSAIAAQQPMRVRGTIESVHGNTLAVKCYDGKTADLMLESGTKYAWVVPSSLSDIKKGDFLGAAATGPANDMKATEVVIFPDSMRGTGEGHYSWSMPAAVARADDHGSGAMSAESMTNGTMTNGTMANGTMANGTMTNGTMTNGTMTNGMMTNSPNGRKLTLSYDNGQKSDIWVPRGAPVVRFVPAQRDILSHGAKVFIMASKSSGKLDAKFVAVGKKGLMPPM